MTIKLTKLVPGLPYKIGQRVPVTRSDRTGKLLWHVWKSIIEIPEGSYEYCE